MKGQASCKGADTWRQTIGLLCCVPYVNNQMAAAIHQYCTKVSEVVPDHADTNIGCIRCSRSLLGCRPGFTLKKLVFIVMCSGVQLLQQVHCWPEGNLAGQIHHRWPQCDGLQATVHECRPKRTELHSLMQDMHKESRST